MKSATQRRENGMGTIYCRENGSWVGRIMTGTNASGDPKMKYFSGKTEADVKRKIRDFYKAGTVVCSNKSTVESYLMNWLLVYKKGTIKRSSYDTLERTAKNQVIPYLGMIQLCSLTSDDIQIHLGYLKDNGYSYSVVKKTYDCLNALLKHAIIKGEILKNPMVNVTLPPQSLFKKKEIRIFSPKEAALISEEAVRQYSTGRLVYIYGYVFILMLHTGLRLGEAIGLEKADWDSDKKLLKIRRNIQSVKKRDSNWNAVTGRELVSNTTKTYSGERDIPLNQTATNALEKLCAEHPDSKYIVCSTKGTMVPPERIERTFNYLLDNIGINREGPHALRHTFASFLFAKKEDIKTVSKLLGHASIQITLNTYIHLLEKAEHHAVSKLDDFTDLPS